ncbi:EPIDERMAL PATTERNING FACTOR-like protein 2 [Phragmites australis]|uniref:EPIDERMAL PATTERNING FACTOR-like protein 2 n=1 Tax=Phragmites australis TaxID=29695 RepID=UPI002D772D71|nr:EPIDERMAL PATTERNING FACTOR-like protein 2 [Phragmites australis]
MGHLFLLLLALLLTSTRASTVHDKAAFTEEKSIAGIRGVIGSRPPSCEGRCRPCGHCEAVQVPISPQELQKNKKLGHGSRAAAYHGVAAGGRAMPASYDDHSNYKPLSWRCKCGRHILDP